MAGICEAVVKKLIFSIAHKQQGISPVEAALYVG